MHKTLFSLAIFQFFSPWKAWTPSRFSARAQVPTAILEVIWVTYEVHTIKLVVYLSACLVSPIFASQPNVCRYYGILVPVRTSFDNASTYKIDHCGYAERRKECVGWRLISSVSRPLLWRGANARNVSQHLNKELRYKRQLARLRCHSFVISNARDKSS